MKPQTVALILAWIGAPAWSADAQRAASHPFSIRDLVMMDRVGDPQLSTDGRYAAYTVTSTDFAANKGTTSVYVLNLAKGGDPIKVADDANTPRWPADGKAVYYLSSSDGVNQVFRRALVDDGGVVSGFAKSVQLTSLPIDVDGFKLSPSGAQMLLTAGAFTDCPDLACTRERLDGRQKDKSSGTIYKRLFVRHWDTWEDGRRNQLYVASTSGNTVEPTLLTHGIDGDIPGKPDGGDDAYTFSADSRTVYFSARIAGTSEPWSTNFDVYSVPTDASTAPRNLTADNLAWDTSPVPSTDGNILYYLAMKVPGAEADRFAVMAMDLRSGARREVAPQWDASPGGLQLSTDNKTIYATADAEGQHALFAVDVASGRATKLTNKGSVGGYSINAKSILLERDDLKVPGDLYAADGHAKNLRQVTHYNLQRLKDMRVGEPEFFNFKGWNDENVQGYVVKPAGYKRGQKYPVAFIIHGGPQGAMNDAWSYRWNPQTYAGQGFAVVTINFHGSQGYGQAFTDSISGDWGGKPLIDLQKGWASALSKYAFLDGDRACALGASYGGYMVYWMAGVWNGPWKCFVDHDGVFDTRAMYYDTDELWFEERENRGTPFENPENYEKFNPVNYVKDWQVPMLVVHSASDFRIPDTQGLGAFTALQRRGIASQLLHFPDETHFVSKPQNSVQWHETVNAWIKKWTSKPGAP